MTYYSDQNLVSFDISVPPPVPVEWISLAGAAVHGYAGAALLGLLALHLGGALKPYFFDTDATPKRMLDT